MRSVDREAILTANFPSESARRIDLLLTRYGRRHDLYVRDLRDGRKLELGGARLYPIGTCFKLAVMMAVFDTLTREEFVTPITISPEQFRPGGGISLLDSAVFHTPLQLVQLMLAASDSTATDWLVERAGFDKVTSVLNGSAPSAHLARNLGDMVSDFLALPEARTCKQRKWSDEELDRFSGDVNAFGAATAHDLATLVWTAWIYEPKPDLHDLYARCLKTRSRTLPRTSTFSPLPMFVKGGSLGRCFFMNDCGVILDASGEAPIAVFGYCVAGGNLPAFMMETVGGLIGLEILKWLGIAVAPNWDWTFETEVMFFPND